MPDSFNKKDISIASVDRNEASGSIAFELTISSTRQQKDIVKN